jgi:thioredoxin 2
MISPRIFSGSKLLFMGFYMDTSLVRCDLCGAVNRIRADKISERPKCGKCRGQFLIHNRVVEVREFEFGKEVSEWPGHALAEFWSPTCGHCLSLRPELDDIAAVMAGRLKVIAINVAQEQALAGKFDIRAVPTFIMFRGGVKTAVLPGALPRKDLDVWIKNSMGI